MLDYHPKGIWAINKSIGVLSHPNNKEEQKKSLLKCSYDFEQECYRWTDPSGISQTLFLVHRLDSATSGVLLATSSEDLAIELKNAFAQRLIHKTYHAIVEFNGRDIPPLWKDTLIKKSSQGKIRVFHKAKLVSHQLLRFLLKKKEKLTVLHRPAQIGT